MVPYLSYGAAMAMLFSGELAPRGEPRRVIPINPTTGRQPIGNPSSNRKAELLRKSLARRLSTPDALKGEN